MKSYLEPFEEFYKLLVKRFQNKARHGTWRKQDLLKIFCDGCYTGYRARMNDEKHSMKKGKP